MFAGKKSAQIREILISESAWEEMTCLFAPSLENRTCSAYPACAPEVRLSGGHYADIGIDQAHVDGNLVTAPAWPAHPQWLAKFVEVLMK